MATPVQGARVHRITLFKVPDPENQQKLVEAYSVLDRDQAKDGKPYILYCNAGRATEDQRSKGYTVAVQSAFASLEDMKYYDNECPAHAALKKTASGLGIPEMPLVVYVEGGPGVVPN